MKYEYDKENIIKLVNDHLDCSFDDMVVVNDGSMYVHNSNDPLCDCSQPNYKPYYEREYNISEFAGVDAIIERDGMSQYRIGYDFITGIPSASKWIKKRTEEEKKKYIDYKYYTTIRWDETGSITDADITAREHDFPLMVVSYETLVGLVDEIKTFNNIKQEAI